MRCISFAVALLAATPAVANRLPGLTGIDHVGFAVPDLEQPASFFAGTMGCTSFDPLGPSSGGDSTWMQDHLNIDPKAEIRAMRLVRCETGSNFGIFQYRAPNQNTQIPRNSDSGGHHIALCTTDMAAAVAHLQKADLTALGTPTTMTGGPSAGESRVYFVALWGTRLERVSYPGGKAYEADSDVRLWDPRS